MTRAPRTAPPPAQPDAAMHALARSRASIAILCGTLLGLLVAGSMQLTTLLRYEQDTLAVVLLPNVEPDPSARGAMLEIARRDPAIASAQWVEPERLRSELQREAGGILGEGALTGDHLPWMLELSVKKGAGALVAGLPARHAEFKDWDLLWDPARYGELERRIELIAWASVALALCVVVLGAAALRGLPAGARNWGAQALQGLIAGGLAAGLLHVCAAAAGAGTNTWPVAAVTAFLLAGVGAGMIRQPALAKAPPQPNPAAAVAPRVPTSPPRTTVGEAVDERPDPRDHPI